MIIILWNYDWTKKNDVTAVFFTFTEYSYLHSFKRFIFWDKLGKLLEIKMSTSATQILSYIFTVLGFIVTVLCATFGGLNGSQTGGK